MPSRLEFFYVSLRGFGECMDVLIIRDMGDSDRELCGDLPRLVLTLSDHVELHLKTGDLEADMPDLLGFSMTYEAVGRFQLEFIACHYYYRHVMFIIYYTLCVTRE